MICMYAYEKLASEYPNININYHHKMPHHLAGLYLGDGDILLNPSVSNTKMYETLQEEIAHYDTTVGDIVTKDTIDSRKQEHRARSLAMTRAVSLDKLIYCHNHGLWELDEIADYCNVDVEYLTDAINNYRVKRGLTFAYKGYRFDLRKNVKIEKI
ncbi:hypothetical protein GIX81_03360 [Lactobacillus reuteri]|uniref:Toxin n=2 Tax=Limosilactobacillus reuteri TaxID=1598 RepID=A0A6L5P4H7_LIMRT|nr:hypothetical protein [Limosilactobacillus reuteri]MRH08447.1 hypothetical protein [Limosilactobacillus reuteri]MRH08497.1 hypothetical protein [Limosilactobacillus reuteri]